MNFEISGTKGRRASGCSFFATFLLTVIPVKCMDETELNGEKLHTVIMLNLVANPRVDVLRHGQMNAYEFSNSSITQNCRSLYPW